MRRFINILSEESENKTNRDEVCKEAWKFVLFFSSDILDLENL